METSARVLLDTLASLSRRFRSRRMAACVRLLGIDANTRVLDVGGAPDLWRLSPVMPRLVVLNQPRAEREARGAVPVVFGDGRALPFADKSIDVVFSNSVIEHVGDAAAQAQFAAEIVRVARRYWVQTPNRRFFAEQHLWMPFVHWLPKHRQGPIIRRATVWEWLTRPAPDQRAFYLEHYLADIRLLTAAEMRQLFPGARIRRERFLGWTKSLIALETAPTPPPPPA